MTQRVSLSLGSNLGDREMNLRRGVTLLSDHVHVYAASSVYETVPVGPAEQPAFLNLAVLGETELPPRELLSAAQAVEYIVGRRPTYRWGPRVLDIDVVLYGNQVIDDVDLVIPHVRMHERAFVLVPLAEVAGDERHPLLQRSIRELAADVSGLETVRPWRS